MTLSLFGAIVLLIVIAVALSTAAMIYIMNYTFTMAMNMQKTLMEQLDDDLSDLPPPVVGTGVNLRPLDI